METRNENSTPWIATLPGTILKYELDDRGLSQKDFAVMIGMQKSHVCELIKGKRVMTKAIADRIEEVLGISAISLVNLQTQYEHDVRIIERKGVEERKAINMLKLYDEIFDVRTIFKRASLSTESAVVKLKYLKEICHLPKPAELQLEVNGMFRKSATTGQDVRMLMTWKILAETKAKTLVAEGVFVREQESEVVDELTAVLHENQDTMTNVTKILSKYGIAFCVEEKIEKVSVDGYSKGGINILVGIDENGTVCGIEFVSLGETPGLGTKIRDNEDFRRQFYGASAPDVQIDTISGATFSSKGLKNAVDTALKVYSENKEVILNGR